MMLTRMRLLLLTIVLSGLTGLPTAGAREDPEVERALAAVHVRAAAGDPIAQYSSGAILYYGREETTQAVEWIRKAAALGYAPAEFHMGQLYDFGFGVARDDREALIWYRKAADHGSAAAQRAVGDFFRKGRATSADAAEAARWYQRAAAGDDIRAQYQLADMHLSGTGAPRDYVAAYIWYSVAASQAPLVDNRKGLLELRNIAAARMTPEQVAEASRRVAAWKPTPGR